MMRLPVSSYSRLLVIYFILGSVVLAKDPDPLPSWKDTPARSAIIEFVECAKSDGCIKWIPPEQRIVVFDNDGTLWAEQPVYFQLLFAMDRIRQLAESHPEWKTEQPYQAVLENDQKALASSGEQAIDKIIAATHAGMTTEEFAEIVRDWLKTARHPVKKKPYTDLVYQPMLEVLEYFRANDFKTYIVSGGGVEFIRVFAEEVYGIPPEQVLGSSIVTKFEMRDGVPVLVRESELNFINDKAGKPVGINQVIGRRPVAAFGNSDGDLQMLQWTTAGEGSRLGVIIHHTDAEREWKYDRQSHIGKLDEALQQAPEKKWTVVDMQQDWKVIFPER